MKKLILLITVSLISISISAQNQDTEYDYYQSELADFKINEILHYPISNLTNNEIINNLKVKVNSDLNTLSSILLNYKFSEQFHLKAKEQSRLQMRMMEMADSFYEQRKLIFLEYAGGISPTYGIKEDMFKDKKVIILRMGGTCIIDEIAYNEKRMHSIFNERMKKNIQNY